MSSQDENAKLFQKMVVFKYVEGAKGKQTREILVSRGVVAQYHVCGVVITATRPRPEDLLTWLLFRLQ